MRVIAFILVATLIILNWAITARGDVSQRQINDEVLLIEVENEPWQPEGFDEALILKAARVKAVPTIDGKGSDPVWSQAESLTVPLTYGSVREATIKAVYTDKEVFLLVSWPDATKDDQHRPWVWNQKLGRYVEGKQVEDSLFVSIEGGCDWTPSLLSGYTYDFDGWLWLAARSDPLGQAVDVDGSVLNRSVPGLGFTKYTSRNKNILWDLKFIDRRPDILTKPWQELKRMYKRTPLEREVYVRYQPDPINRKRRPEFTTKHPAPDNKQGSNILSPQTAHAAQTPLLIAPQYKPAKLTGDAGEVAAKGRWEDGRWTVEFRRVLITPSRTITDSVFERVTQFSIHVFDHVEGLDKSSESGRLFIQFEPLSKTEK